MRNPGVFGMSVCELTDVLHCPWTGMSCALGVLCCIYTVPGLDCFVSPGVHLVQTTLNSYTERPRTPPHNPRKITAEPGVYGNLEWRTWLTPFSIGSRRSLQLSLGALILECNDLSQFREDKSELCMSIREYNLITCPLARSC